MKIGLLTNFLVKEGMEDLEEIANWAHDNDFEDLEVGPTIPLNRQAFTRVLETGKINITSLIYCRNYLSTNKEEANEHLLQLRRRLEFAKEFGIKNIITSTGIDKSIEEGIYDKADAIRKIPIRSLDLFVDTFGELVELADKYDVNLAFENCPLMGNIAISPYMWGKIFERLDSQCVGLAFDPSHLVWQFIDPYEAILAYGHKIKHVHAKDTEIFKNILRKRGILTDFSWWRYRIPGKGEIKWEKLLSCLKKINYNKTISIEHEDPFYENSLEKVKEGLILGKEHLCQFI